MGRAKFGIAKQFTSEIASINVFLKELHQFWARALGISWPQWMILTAVSDLAESNGVPVNAVAGQLHVAASFVTKESKLLEKEGLVRREPSQSDARVVQMSLTEKACTHLAALAAQQEAIHDFIFEDFSEDELRDFTIKLATLSNRVEKATLKIALDF